MDKSKCFTTLPLTRKIAADKYNRIGEVLFLFRNTAVQERRSNVVTITNKNGGKIDYSVRLVQYPANRAKVSGSATYVLQNGGVTSFDI